MSFGIVGQTFFDAENLERPIAKRIDGIVKYLLNVKFFSK